MSVRSSNHECEVVHELWEAETVGRLLSRSEVELVAEHLATCATCRFEADSLATLDLDHPAGSPAYLEDDLSRRRWIDDAIDAAEEHPRQARSPGRRWALGLAAAVLLVAVGAVVAWSVIDRAGPEGQPEAIAATDVPAALAGQVVLTAGEPTGEPGGLRPGAGFGAGQRLAARDGAVVVELASGITALLDRDARGRVARLDDERIAVELSQGRIFAAVDPDRQGPELEVLTDQGRVRITGTVLAVEVAGDRATVEVYRGQVMVEEPDGKERGVEVGQRAVLGSAGRERLSRAAEDRALATLKMIDLLDPAGESTIELRSLPGGAEVELDQVVLGATPLEAAVRPGHRVVELSLTGHLPVRELLELGQGDRLSRVFDLEQEAAAETEGAAEVVAAARPVPANRLSAAELLARAQEQRASRNVRGAAASYDKLIRNYPASAEARAALVSLGTIQLDRLGKPGRALGLFDRYLKRSKRGTLAQEAAYGRVRALRKLGRRQAEIDGLEQFLKTYPGAVQAGLARQRLAELDRTETN